MFFKKKDRKQKEDPVVKREAQQQNLREELQRKRALYEEAVMSLSAYSAWAYPADMG